MLSKKDRRVKLLSYEAFCGNPAAGLERLSTLLDVKDRDKFLKLSSKIRIANPHPVNIEGVDKDVLQKVHGLHDELVNASFV
ncbi:MAG: hypothetical protein QNL62_11400 [Gammaproteobacteria bacterium]|nr:hypothetical protein [Gammaproteobacteria bacterium]